MMRLPNKSQLSFFIQLINSLILLFFIFFLLLIPNTANSYGKGPIGLWPVTDRYTLVADSSLPGVVLVDLLTGTTVERLVMQDANPTCITSCPNCNFVLVTGSGGYSWKLHFKDKLSDLLQKTGKLDLSHAHIEPLDLSTQGGSKNGKIDARICLVSNDGNTAFFAALKDHAVFHLDLTKQSYVSRLLKDKSIAPYGLNWDKNGDILVAMHKKEVWRINKNGKKLAVYNTAKAGCPGTAKFNPNLRAAIDDPTHTNSLIIMTSNPGSYDAVIWRLKYNTAGDSIKCTTLAGKIGGDSGWLDSLEGGSSVQFSRPHYFKLLPDGEKNKIIVSDIDNRALRIVNLLNGHTTSILYDRDRRLKAIPEKEKKSAISCQKQNWKNSGLSSNSLGNRSCIQSLPKETPPMSYDKARAFCKAKGARLCEPAELRYTDVLTGGKSTWTSAACASCWQRKENMQCNPIIKTFKTPKAHHKAKEFKQSWRSGQVIETGRMISNGPRSLCREANKNYKSTAICCADEF